MDTSKSRRLPLPIGLSFKVEDLVRIKKWSDRNNVVVAIRLDHGIPGEEYEEVVAFHTRRSPFCRLIMWRDAESVFVQPLIGVRERYASVYDALASLRLKQRVVPTDITLTPWPIVQFWTELVDVFLWRASLTWLETMRDCYGHIQVTPPAAPNGSFIQGRRPCSHQEGAFH